MKSIIKTHINYCFAIGDNTYINYRSTQPAVSIIVSVQIDLTASKSIQTIVLYLFYIVRLFTNLLLIHFQTKNSDMHVYVCALMVIIRWCQKPETKQPAFEPCFFYNMFSYLLTNLFIGVTFFYWQVFFKQVKEINEITNFQAHLFYNTML